MSKAKSASDVSKMIKDHDVKLVDFKFTDLPGTWQHFTTTLTEYNEDIFTEGLGFDGSSIRGWKVIDASDMLAMPDPNTAFIDIFNAEPTLSLTCTIADPITREPTTATRAASPRRRKLSQEHRHRRYRLLRAGSGVLHLRQRAFQLRTQRHLLSGRQRRRPLEQRPRRESEPRLQDSAQGRLFPGRRRPTLSRTSAPRCASSWRKWACRSSGSIMKWPPPVRPRSISASHPLKIMGDSMMFYKYIVKNVAKQHGKTVTFMPKPLFGDNGSGMHTHSRCGRRASRSSPATIMRASAKWPSITSAAS